MLKTGLNILSLEQKVYNADNLDQLVNVTILINSYEWKRPQVILENTIMQSECTEYKTNRTNRQNKHNL